MNQEYINTKGEWVNARKNLREFLDSKENEIPKVTKLEVQ